MKNSLKALCATLAISAVASTAVATNAFAAEPTMSFRLDSGSASGKVIEIKESAIKAAAAEDKAVEVKATISVDNGVKDDYYWCASGIHLFFDEDLTISTKKVGSGTKVNYEEGVASENISGWEVLMMEADALPGDGTNGVFYATMGTENLGTNGDIITFTFSVPNTAVAGDEFNFNLKPQDKDQFTNIDGDKAMQESVFASVAADIEGTIKIVADAPTTTPEPPTTTPAATTTPAPTTTPAIVATTTAAPATAAPATTTKAPTTTAAATTTSKTDAPPTGVPGVGVAVAGLVAAAGAAFALRKKND